MKTDTLNLRIAPETKAMLRRIAELEKGSLSHLIDLFVAGYCKDKGIPQDSGAAKSSRLRTTAKK